MKLDQFNSKKESEVKDFLSECGIKCEICDF